MRDVGSIPDPGGGNDNPFQYSCLENSVDRLWGHKEWDTNEHTCFASLSYIYGCCPFNESTQLLVLTSCPVKWPSCWRTSGLPDSPDAEPGAPMTHTHSTQRGTLSHQAWVRGRSRSVPFSFLPAEATEVTKAGVPATHSVQRLRKQHFDFTAFVFSGMSSPLTQWWHILLSVILSGNMKLVIFQQFYSEQTALSAYMCVHI